MPESLEDLVELLDLEMIDVDLFRGRQPQTSMQRVFGGQVLGQALAAASRTVDPERVVHSLHGYFLRAGDTAVPIVYRPEPTRDGGSFSSRRVVASQNGKPIFYMSASFQRPEAGLDHQDPMPDDVVPPEEAPRLATVLEARVGTVGGRLGQGVGGARRTPGRSHRPAVLDPGRRQASRRSRLACLRSRLRQRPDVARGKLVAARHRDRRPPDPARLARPCAVVPPPVPRRRVAPLRPGVAVGLRRPRLRHRPPLQPNGSLDRLGRPGRPHPPGRPRPGRRL